LSGGTREFDAMVIEVDARHASVWQDRSGHTQRYGPDTAAHVEAP
jgi:hypothetical protein